MDMVPNELMFNGQLYKLHIETVGNMITLTYEHEPIQEDSYLLATIGSTLEQASDSMRHHFELNEICF